MKRAVLKHHPQKVAGRAPAATSVLVVYEDSVTCQRAKQAINGLARRLEVAVAGLKTKLWKSDSLKLPVMGELAAVEAVAADVLILSFHGTRELSFAVRDWLAGWLEQKEERPYALGILLDPHVLSQGKNHPVVAYLEQVAVAAEADVFYGAAETASPGWNESRFNPMDERAHYISEVIKSILRHSEARPGKGSNE